MRSPTRFSRRLLLGDLTPAAMGLALTFSAITSHPVLAAPSLDEILFQSSDLKIYRALSHGNPVVVLTNVDAEGNLLSGGEGSDVLPSAPQTRPAPALPRAEEPREGPPAGTSGHVAGPGGTSDGGRVRVVVNGDGGTAPVDQRDVVVTTDGTGGTTVIININPPGPEKRDHVELPAWSYPIVALGGLPGAFRYPEHQYFLGYGPSTSSPSMFGGLGLNAGNRFGLKSGVPCDRGFDCMFGPVPGRP